MVIVHLVNGDVINVINQDPDEFIDKLHNKEFEWIYVDREDSITDKKSLIKRDAVAMIDFNN